MAELSPQKSRTEFTQNKRGAELNPGVIGYLFPIKTNPIGTVFSDDFCVCQKVLVINEQGTTLTALNIFSLVKGIGGKVAD